MLKLLKDALPDDLSFCLLPQAETTQRQVLLKCLSALREEASDRAKKVEAALQEVGGGPESEGEELVPAQEDPGLVLSTDAMLRTL